MSRLLVLCSLMLVLSLSVFAEDECGMWDDGCEVAAKFKSSEDVWEALPDIPHSTILSIAADARELAETTGGLSDEEMIEKILRENLPERFTKIDVTLDGDNFKMTTKYRLFWFFKIKLRLGGVMEFDYDTFTVRLRMDKAKALFFSIRGKIFDYVKKMDHPAIFVEEPFIIIDLFGV